MKVGTDAVLLGAWVEVGKATRILDVGTGSGVIALMMAQRAMPGGIVDAVEPDGESVIQATENVNASPWPGKVHVHQNSIQEFRSEARYDLIVSNPPFFRRSLLPPNQGRQVARHAETLDFDELLTAVTRLLHEDGSFGVVLPTTEGDLFREQAKIHGLTCHRSMAFYTRREKPQERWLMEFSFRGKREKLPPESIVLYLHNEKWSEGYAELTRDFYL